MFLGSSLASPSYRAKYNRQIRQTVCAYIVGRKLSPGNPSLLVDVLKILPVFDIFPLPYDSETPKIGVIHPQFFEFSAHKHQHTRIHMRTVGPKHHIIHSCGMVWYTRV